MSEKQFKLSSETVLQYQIMDNDTDLNENEVVDLLNKLYEENEQLRNELQFYDKIINFFASNPMTKYSSKADLIEEMTLLEKMGLL